LKTGYQNLHTHTTYCDGKQTAEEMIKTAIQMGGGSIGFSEHSYVPFDKDYSMTIENTPKYIDEVNMLKEKYKNDIEVFLGIELDRCADKTPEGLDYIIGSSHHVEKEKQHVTVDGAYSHVKHMNDAYFGGDYLSMAELYFDTLADIAEKTGADIIGHFDLIAKHNLDGKMFDEMHPRYVKAALEAMDIILEKCKIFEVNTGAMYRIGKKEPYPNKHLLKELNKRGGRVLLTSDSHNAKSLYYMFDEMRELLKACGFKHIKRLTKDGFIDEKLE